MPTSGIAEIKLDFTSVVAAVAAVVVGIVGIVLVNT